MTIEKNLEKIELQYQDSLQSRSWVKILYNSGFIDQLLERYNYKRKSIVIKLISGSKIIEPQANLFNIEKIEYNEFVLFVQLILDDDREIQDLNQDEIIIFFKPEEQGMLRLSALQDDLEKAKLETIKKEQESNKEKLKLQEEHRIRYQIWQKSREFEDR